MTAEDVQATGSYRGFSLSRILPFSVRGKITVNDLPLDNQISSTNTEYRKTDIFYLYKQCYVMAGTASFLVYGKAPRGERTKAENGSIVEQFPLDIAPNNIRFGLESITERTAHPTATSLAGYMTAIATAEGNGIAWKDAPSASLQVMFLNFIKTTEVTGGGDIIPGSAANVYADAQYLKTNLNALSLTNEDDIAIRAAIIEKIDEYNTAWDGFPASIGLPDGATVIRWDGTEFKPQLTYTSFADINGIDRFAYPAELYYYGNSRIATSNIDDREDAYTTNTTWNDVLAEYEYTNSVVTNSTTSVAIKDPIQYGVSRLQIILKKTTYTLDDANGINVNVGTANFPLTGIIVGGQLPVGFDFSPNTSYPVYSEADVKCIYDPLVKTNGTAGNEYFYLSHEADATKMTNTLVLQSYNHKKVPVLLEFINNSNIDFKGQGGIILRGTKFYLAGEIDPADGTGGDTNATGRVFTQDYTTTLNMKVTSLAKAYNVVPNLLSPRLELGIELVPKWTSTTPEEIVL